MYLSAKLSLGSLSNEEILDKVEMVLTDLNLMRVKNLVVGGVLNKSISGGERKRLNIAIELIREPLILLVDEPTSGLSSLDALNVINLLKEQAVNGKVVIINLHQPSINIFNQLNKLFLLDKGGYPVYAGNPAEAYEYFRGKAHLIEIKHAEVQNLVSDPSRLFEILEEKKIDQYGQYSSERKNTPEDWYQIFLKEQVDTDISIEKKSLPEKYNTPAKCDSSNSYYSRSVIY